MDRVVWKISLPQVVLRTWKYWIKSLRENTNCGNSVVKVHYHEKYVKINSYVYMNCYVNTANINLLCQHLSTYFMTVATIMSLLYGSLLHDKCKYDSAFYMTVPTI